MREENVLETYRKMYEKCTKNCDNFRTIEVCKKEDKRNEIFWK